MGTFRATLIRERLVKKSFVERVAEVLMDDEEYEEYEVEAEVEYEVEGRWDRDDHPDVCLLGATDTATGKAMRLTTREETRLILRASTYAADDLRERMVDAAEMEYDARKEEGLA